jgi:hypothetical protein
MANLDKTSVRTEVSRLKADFEKLCADGKITGESQAVMNSLFMVVELILAIFLERTTKKDATNSSKPSSQTGKDESALGHSGIHDCWSSYFAYQHCRHGLCGSHLLRELTFMVDAHGYRWAKNMKRLLQDTCITVSKSTDTHQDRRLQTLRAPVPFHHRSLKIHQSDQVVPINN